MVHKIKYIKNEIDTGHSLYFETSYLKDFLRTLVVIYFSFVFRAIVWEQLKKEAVLFLILTLKH